MALLQCLPRAPLRAAQTTRAPPDPAAAIPPPFLAGKHCRDLSPRHSHQSRVLGTRCSCHPPPARHCSQGSPHCCSVVAAAAPACLTVTSSPCCPPSPCAVWGGDKKTSLLLPPSPWDWASLSCLRRHLGSLGEVCSEVGSFAQQYPASFTSHHCQSPPPGKAPSQRLPAVPLGAAPMLVGCPPF